MNKKWQEATRRGDVEQVRLLLAHRENIDAKDKYGQTALMIATHAGHVELVRLLLERGADLDITAKYNLSALMLALIGRHFEAARLLIEAGADVNIRSTSGFGGKTARSLAESVDGGEVVELLKKRGAAL